MTTITALPEAPNRGTDDPANFSSKADTFVAALQTFQFEANLVATETNAAAGSAVAAAAAATSVTGVAKWAGTTTSYTNGAAVWSPANYKTYRLSIASKAANGANTDPSVDTASWALVNGTGDVIATATQTLTNKTLSNVLGSAALPSYAFTGDLNTGAWSPIADTYSISTGGIERARVDSSGNVLVGTTASLGGKLNIASAAGVTSIVTTNDTVNSFFGGGDGSRYTALGTNSNVDLLVFTNSLERIRINSSGTLLVGTTNDSGAQGFLYSPTAQQSALGHTNGTVSGTNYTNFLYNSFGIGSITQSGTTAVLYNTTSDQRLKTNIIDAPDASALIDSINVRSFDWISDGSHQRYGMVAQELFEVAPEAVHTPSDPTEMMAVDYSKLVPMLIKEIQSLRARVAALEV